MAPQSPDGVSIRVQCWRDPQTGVTRLRVERIDPEEEIELGNSAFLLRIAFDRGRRVERCFIRHLPSGREAYVQGGPGLTTLIRDSLLGGNSTEPELEGVDDDHT